MNRGNLQAYQQAPWRKQIQWIGTFFVILVALAAVAGVYLSLSGRAASTGRRIQVLEYEVEVLALEIGDLNTQLAQVSSARSLYERLSNLDMREYDPITALYVEVPGYQPQSAVVLAPPPSMQTGHENPVILPEFTTSLFDWLRVQLAEGRAQTPGNQETP